VLKVISVVAVFAFATTSVAQNAPSDPAASALNELSMELMECSVYFLTVSTCVSQFPDPRAPDAVRSYRKAADDMGTLAANVGAPVGVSTRALLARQKMVYDDIMASIDKNCVNVSVPMERYNKFCKQLSTNPDIRIKEIASGRICGGSYRC